MCGSLKKRTAPAPPAGTIMYNTQNTSHSRTPSDPIQNAQPQTPGILIGFIPSLRIKNVRISEVRNETCIVNYNHFYHRFFSSNYLKGNIFLVYNAHKRSPSTDSTKQLAGAKLVLPSNQVLPVLKPVDRSGSCTPNLSGTLQKNSSK